MKAGAYTIGLAKKKNPAAVALGKLRARKVSAERQREIASMGGRARAEAISEEELNRIVTKAGKSGGKARAAKLTKEQRSETARKAAVARWKKQKGSNSG
jgi:hypothetical protein